MDEPQKYTHRVKRNLRSQWREERRQAMTAETVSLGVVLIGALAAVVTLGNSL